MAELEIRCSKCSFRVDDRYFSRKKLFSVHCCPNCGSLINVVDYATDKPLPGYHVDRVSRLVVPEVA